ncbi:MAG: hypothetical protein IPP36_07345 [Nitrosomonadales bacterium]|nr:hypothetical protein [Nitrosomonadales bacterium]
MRLFLVIVLQLICCILRKHGHGRTTWQIRLVIKPQECGFEKSWNEALTQKLSSDSSTTSLVKDSMHLEAVESDSS